MQKYQLNIRRLFILLICGEPKEKHWLVPKKNKLVSIVLHSECDISESQHYNKDIIQFANFDLKSFRFGFATCFFDGIGFEKF